MVQPICEIEDNEDARPIIVQFQNSDLKNPDTKKLHTGVFKQNDDSKIVAVATEKILYTGNVDKNQKNDLYNRFLLVSNKKTGKVKLVAVDTAILSPQFKQKEKEIFKKDQTPNFANSMSKLNKEFGSKKIKRITEQRERLKMDIENVKEQLEQTVARVEVGESDSFVVESSENDSAYRPPINREAATREDVYVLDDIVPENVLNSLEEEAQHVLSSDLDELELSPFIKDKVKQLQESSASNVMDKCKLLLYIDYLIKFILKPAKNITKRFVICSSSNEVNNYILDNFSVLTNSSRTRPIAMRDKTICHILVITMIALDYQIDIELLSKNIKLGVKKLQEMGRVLAFSSASGKNKNLMILKMPLPPAVSTSPRKRKR